MKNKGGKPAHDAYERAWTCSRGPWTCRNFKARALFREIRRAMASARAQAWFGTPCNRCARPNRSIRCHIYVQSLSMTPIRAPSRSVERPVASESAGMLFARSLLITSIDRIQMLGLPTLRTGGIKSPLARGAAGAHAQTGAYSTQHQSSAFDRLGKARR